MRVSLGELSFLPQALLEVAVIIKSLKCCLFFFFSLSFHCPTPLLLCADEALICLGPGEWDASGLLHLSVPGQQQVSPVEDYTQQTPNMGRCSERRLPCLLARGSQLLVPLISRIKNTPDLT